MPIVPGSGNESMFNVEWQKHFMEESTKLQPNVTHPREFFSVTAVARDYRLLLRHLKQVYIYDITRDSVHGVRGPSYGRSTTSDSFEQSTKLGKGLFMRSSTDGVGTAGGDIDSREWSTEKQPFPPDPELKDSLGEALKEGITSEDIREYLRAEETRQRIKRETGKS